MSNWASVFRNRPSIFVIVSGAILSALIAFDTTAQGIAAAAFTLPAAFACYAYLCRKFQYAEKYLRFQNTFASYFSIVCSVYSLYLISDRSFTSGIGTALRNQFFAGSEAMMIAGLAALSLVMFPAAYAFFHWLSRAIGTLLSAVCRRTDRYERTVSLVFLGMVLTLLIVAYTQTSIFSNCFYQDARGEIAYRSVDTLLDIDSPYVLRNLMNIEDINARHIFAKMLLLPVSIPARILSMPFYAREQVFALLITFAASAELLIAALIVSRLSGERFLLPLLLCSYPFLLFSLTFERNQLALLLLVLAVYLNVGEERTKHSDLGRLSSIGLAAGATTTSALIGLFVLEAKSLREYVLQGLKAIGALLGMILLAGKVKLFLMLDTAVESFVAHSSKSAGFLSRILHYTESVQSMLFPSAVYVDSAMESGGLVVRTLFNTVYRMDFTLSIIGVVVILLALAGSIVHRKDMFVKVCIGWCCCHVLIFPVLGFSASTYLLHAVMFSWAYLTLAYKGFRWCVRRVPARIVRIAEYALLAALLIFSLNFLYQVLRFGMENYPIIAGL